MAVGGHMVVGQAVLGPRTIERIAMRWFVDETTMVWAIENGICRMRVIPQNDGSLAADPYTITEAAAEYGLSQDGLRALLRARTIPRKEG